mgnify:CR=1 FL=1
MLDRAMQSKYGDDLQAGEIQEIAELKKIRRNESLQHWLSLFSPLLILLLWEVLSRANLLDVRFFPPPTGILSTFVGMILSGELISALGISLYRVMLGFILGAVPALILGILMGVSRIFRSFMDPIIGALLPIPKLALLPLIMLLFGIGEMSKVVTIASGVFFYVLMDTVVGVANIEKIHTEVARNYGARGLDYFRTVAFPGALPLIFNGIKLGQGVGLLLIVAAEMIGADNGIGYLIWSGYQTFALERMYVGLIMMGFLGFLTSTILSRLERVVVPWKH